MESEIEFKEVQQKRITYAKHRVLLIMSRGMNSRGRALFEDLKVLIPHNKQEPSFDTRGSFSDIKEIAASRNCDVCVFLECKHNVDLYLHIASVPHGPTVRFEVNNITGMEDYRFEGNCVKGSRPILSFDTEFEMNPHLDLTRELLKQAFSTPNLHPKSKPFIDRIMSFSSSQGEIMVRNYEVKEEKSGKETEPVLTELGPRFSLRLVRISDGCFHGEPLWTDKSYVPSSATKQGIKVAAQAKFIKKIKEKEEREARAIETPTAHEDNVWREVAPLKDYTRYNTGELDGQIDEKNLEWDM